MAAHALYIAKSCTVATVALKGFVSIAITQRAQTVSPRGDGKLFREKTCTVAVEETVEIEAEDAGVAPALGATGALDAKGVQLADGIALGGDLAIATVASASVTVNDIQRTVDMEGRPRLRLSLSVNSAAGIASGLSITPPA